MRSVADHRARIAAILSGRLNLDLPSADVDLIDSGLLDSLAFVDLLFHLEQEFGITVSLDQLEIENFRSVERIATFVDDLSRARADLRD